MPGSEDRVQRLERELADARMEVIKEDAQRYRIIMRHIDPDQLQKIKEGLTDRHEMVLFGLAVADLPKKATSRSGAGDQTCPYCGQKGFVERGLKLHITRKHPDKKEND